MEQPQQHIRQHSSNSNFNGFETHRRSSESTFIQQNGKPTNRQEYDTLRNCETQNSTFEPTNTQPLHNHLRLAILQQRRRLSPCWPHRSLISLTSLLAEGVLEEPASDTHNVSGSHITGPHLPQPQRSRTQALINTHTHTAVAGHTPQLGLHPDTKPKWLQRVLHMTWAPSPSCIGRTISCPTLTI